MNEKIKDHHLARKAILYVRQSSQQQVAREYSMHPCPVRSRGFSRAPRCPEGPRGAPRYNDASAHRTQISAAL